MEMHGIEIHIKSKFDVLLSSQDQNVERYVTALQDDGFSGQRSNSELRILISEKFNLNFKECVDGRLPKLNDNHVEHSDDHIQNDRLYSKRCDEFHTQPNMTFKARTHQDTRSGFSSEAHPGRKAGSGLFLLCNRVAHSHHLKFN